MMRPWFLWIALLVVGGSPCFAQPEPQPQLPPPPVTSAPAPTPEPQQEPPPPPISAPARPAELKTLTWDLRAQILTLAPERAREDLLTSFEALGVYIHSNTDLSFELRVPAEALDQVVALLQHRADLVDLSTQSQDVALEWSNLAARQRVLQDSRQRLVEMLALSSTVSDTLLIERELNTVTAELESIQGRFKALTHRMQFAPLSLTITQRSEERPKLKRTNNPFAWVSDYGPRALLKGSY